ncbi:hypothetical protein P43SY_001861 [Pythium insidiosum]|uniref:6-phosphogluconolactonase n=1 Tax=Pythium insidiosum TaxID=114742 RepID=A0AAD5M146_PYTIN|nr:hypothetical protein P43SY_001861 [Pythium insidiosum]
MTKAVLYVGTYTQRLDHVDGKGQGVHAFEMDVATGALTPLSVLPVEQCGVNPSYVCCSATAFSNTHKTLYAVNETDAQSASSPSTTTGYVRAFAIEGRGVLRPLSTHETTGAWPCHVSIWDRAGPHGAFVAVSNYGGGSVALYPIDSQDGSLRPACDVHAFAGASHVVPDRQEAAHVHSATWLHQPGTASLLVADLGNDRVAQLTLDADSKKLRPLSATPFLTRPPGSGPRHLTIHPTLRMVYVLDELSSTIGVHPIVDDVDQGGSVAPVAIQRISTLPSGFKDFNLGADIHLSTCGRYLYASNRGHDSIACFRVHTMPATTDPHPHPRGWLELLGHTSTRGAFPRGFLIYRDWLLVANQNSDTIEVFQIDGDSGALRHSGHNVACPTPVSLCIPSE